MKKKDLDFIRKKKYFDKLIRDDKFKDLTITYNFEDDVIDRNRKIASLWVENLQAQISTIT